MAALHAANDVTWAQQMLPSDCCVLPLTNSNGNAGVVSNEKDVGSDKLIQGYYVLLLTLVPFRKWSLS